MRINLSVPFEEKDQAKALGAWWDPARRTWFIRDVEDLTPFMRWVSHQQEKPVLPRKTKRDKAKIFRPAYTKSAVYVPHCGCYDMPPWEDCCHTADLGIEDDQLSHLRSIMSA